MSSTNTGHPPLIPSQIEILGAVDSVANETKDVIRRFHEAFDKHDPEAMEDLVADECVIENTNPAPNGSRHVGKAACLAIWQGLARSTGTGFEREEVFVVGERVVIRWRYRWGEDDDQSIRGINLMRVHGGRIVEAMGYVKGQ
jgi:ketosteroid isomerase-like protein